MSSQRDAIRSATVGGKRQFRRRFVKYFPPVFENVEITGPDGEVLVESNLVGKGDPIMVEIRQPTIAERNAVFSKHAGKPGLEMELILWMAINQTFVPGTDEQIYEEADYDALKTQPAGGFVDQFGQAALELMNIDIEGATKNSEKTA